MSKCILVVEDQEDNRRILRDLLGNAGYELIEAESGEDALAAVMTRRPDLILREIQFSACSQVLERTAIVQLSLGNRRNTYVSLDAKEYPSITLIFPPHWYTVGTRTWTKRSTHAEQNHHTGGRRAARWQLNLGHGSARLPRPSAAIRNGQLRTALYD